LQATVVVDKYILLFEKHIENRFPWKRFFLCPEVGPEVNQAFNQHTGPLPEQAVGLVKYQVVKKSVLKNHIGI